MGRVIARTTLLLEGGPSSPAINQRRRVTGAAELMVACEIGMLIFFVRSKRT
jgi:hypothetical protein